MEMHAYFEDYLETAQRILGRYVGFCSEFLWV